MSLESNEYVVARLLSERGLIGGAPLGLGDVELRPARMDTPSEREALDHSANSYDEKINLDIGSRLVTVVVAKDIRKADTTATNRFQHALDAVAAFAPPLGEYRLLEAGFIRELSSGNVEHRRQALVSDKPFGPFLTAMVMPERYPQLEASIGYDPKKNTE